MSFRVVDSSGNEIDGTTFASFDELNLKDEILRAIYASQDAYNNHHQLTKLELVKR
jgi:hypothetical protein